MNPEIAADFIIRSLWAFGIISVGILLYRGMNRLLLTRANYRTAGLESQRPHIPILLYFTTPSCAPCKTIQRPAIDRLQKITGERLQVIEVDAIDQPAIATRWGVLSVPTTFMIDANGHPRYVNHGAVSTNKLLQQFNEL